MLAENDKNNMQTEYQTKFISIGWDKILRLKFNLMIHFIQKFN